LLQQFHVGSEAYTDSQQCVMLVGSTQAGQHKQGVQHRQGVDVI